MRPNVLLIGLAAASFTLTSTAQAQFTAFQGNSATETTWRAAAAAILGGPVPKETFESFRGVPTPFSGPSDQITALPALGVVFTSGVPGAYPGVYTDVRWAHSGVNQLSNFGGGLGDFADYDILPAPGRVIRALAVWQCDPQGNLTLQAFNASGAQAGQIVAGINNGSGNSFAGFTSSAPILRVRVLGAEGDGWNHLDDLQVVSLPISLACNLADITDIGDSGAGPDGQLTVDDLIAFVNSFSDGAGCPGVIRCNIADVSDIGSTGAGPDGQLTVDDLIAFVNAFGDGC